MALLFMEGFDWADTVTHLREDYQLSDNNTTIGWSIVTGRLADGKALRMTATYPIYFHLDAKSAATTHWCNFAIKTVDYPTSNRALAYFYAADGSVLYSLWIDNAGLLSFVRGTGTTLGTATTALPTNVWNNISFTVFLNNTTGTVVLSINGEEEINLSSQDTLEGTVTDVAFFFLQTPLTADDCTFDDLIFGDNSGSDLTTVPGDCHIEMLTPDGDGATNDGTAVGAGTTNADRVDDGATPDDDTTYVHFSTATNKELYTFSNITLTGDAYYAVQVRARTRKEGAGLRRQALTMRSNVTEVDSANQGMSVDYGTQRWLQENDPNGGGDWTLSAINGMQAGVELKT